jgi:hypothetical protein
MAKGSSGGFGQQIDIRIAAAAIAGAIVVFGGLFYVMSRPQDSIVVPPTPEEATVMVLNSSIERLVEAISASGKAPKNVAELPALPDGTVPATTDGWSNEILMKITGGGSRYMAEFRSKGPDGVAGNGDDIVVEGVLEKFPNGSRYYVSAQSQKGGLPPTPPETSEGG